MKWLDFVNLKPDRLTSVAIDVEFSGRATGLLPN